MSDNNDNPEIQRTSSYKEALDKTSSAAKPVLSVISNLQHGARERHDSITTETSEIAGGGGGGGDVIVDVGDSHARKSHHQVVETVDEKHSAVSKLEPNPDPEADTPGFSEREDVLKLDLGGSGDKPDRSSANSPDPPHEGRQADVHYDEHLLSVEEFAATQTQTNLNLKNLRESRGLTEDEAFRRLEADGLNQLTPPKRKPWIVVLLLQFLDPFLIMLIISGVLAFITYGINFQITNVYVGAALFVVVFITGVASFLQELKTAKVMQLFKNLLPPSCLVIRDGVEYHLPATRLVVGDLVRVNGGDKMPADLRVLESQNAKVELAALTGESLPITVSNQAVSASITPVQSRCITFSGTFCIEGSMLGVVIRTGDNTYIGNIANLASGKPPKTLMQLELERTVKFISILALVTGSAAFAIGAGRNPDRVLDVFIFGFLVIIVANIPQGLPATVTSLLTITASKMASQNVLVKKLECIETLGSASLICTDKTGTLTQNLMSVVEVSVDNERFSDEYRRRLDPTQSGSVTPHPSMVEKHRMMMARTMQRDSDPAHAAAATAAAAAGSAGLAETEFEAAPVPTSDRIPGYAHYSLAFEMLHRIASVCNKAAIETVVDEKELSSQNRRRRRRMAAKGMEATGAVVPPTGKAKKKGLAGAVTTVDIHDDINDDDDDDDDDDDGGDDDDDDGDDNEIGGGHGGVTSDDDDDDDNRAPKSKKNKKKSKKEKVTGNASDVALFNFCNELRSVQQMREAFPVIFEIPFNSTNKWQLMITLDQHSSSQQLMSLSDRQQHYLMMKGAPEIVLTKCTHALVNGQEVPIDDEYNAHFQRTYHKFASRGCRVLGFAHKYFDALPAGESYSEESMNFPINDLTFVGMVAIMDPPRPDVKYAIRKCRSAGIKVFMVTGDHQLTAEVIARDVGILRKSTKASKYNVILGSDINKLSENDWRKIVSQDGAVFARTTPQQKLKIVKSCQALKQVVAVTGDGVNDAPALKHADIGVAMGISGSDVAREAASVVLLDDNFASVVIGIEQGRLIFDNLKKTVAFTLTHLLPEVIPVMLNLFLELPNGLSAMQILSIDLGTELGPAISLAYEGVESDIMRRRPRNVKTDRMVSRQLVIYSYLIIGMIETFGCFFAYFWVFYSHGPTFSDLFFTSNNNWIPDADDNLCLGDKCFSSLDQEEIAFEAASSYYITLVLSQLIHVFSCKTRRISLLKHDLTANSVTFWGIGLSLCMMIILVYVPGVQTVMQSQPANATPWVVGIITGGVIILFNEWRKRFVVRYPSSRLAKELRW